MVAGACRVYFDDWGRESPGSLCGAIAPLSTTAPLAQRSRVFGLRLWLLGLVGQEWHTQEATRKPRKLLIAQLKITILSILEPISLTDIKASLLGYRLSSINVYSTLKLLLKPRIILELGK